jgi:hypothetical protein
VPRSKARGALLDLGMMQAAGHGTPADANSAAVNVLRASLAGFEEARGVFEKIIRPAIPAESWPSIFDRVKWPHLIFMMGPLAEGHLDLIRQSQENDDGSEDPE